MLHILLFALLVLFGVGIGNFVHELGHLVASRLAGYRVIRFHIGLGPTVLALRFGGTYYSVSAFPIVGGCVFVPGAKWREHLSEFRDLETMNRRARDLIEESEDPANWMERRSLFAEMLVFAAGPLANLATALLIAAFVPVTAERLFEQPPHEVFLLSLFWFCVVDFLQILPSPPLSAGCSGSDGWGVLSALILALIMWREGTTERPDRERADRILSAALLVVVALLMAVGFGAAIVLMRSR